MIRVSIIADTSEHAQAWAAALSEADRLDVIDAVSSGIDGHMGDTGISDVTVAVGLRQAEVRRIRGPVVAIGIGGNSQPFGRNVRAWMPPTAPLGQLEAAIVAAANDLVALTTEQSQRWLPRESEANANTFLEALTQRELQVLRMLADGLGNKEIAADLGISDHTAKFHVSQVLAKLGVTSRAEAVAIGMRRGLVPI